MEEHNKERETMLETTSNKRCTSYEMYWSESLGGNSEICPKCKTVLKNEYQTYLVFVKIKKEIDPHITGNKGGYFCPNCSVVVLDNDTFNKAMKSAVFIHNPNINSLKFAVSGIVDYDAIPEDKKDKELGTKDNPVPIINLENCSKKNAANTENSYSSRKVGRNNPCPCGLGKKYKKCCGKLV